MFVGPGEEVYEGMIVGENARDADMDVERYRPEKANQHASIQRGRSYPPDPASPVELWNKPSNSSLTTSWLKLTPKTIRLRKKNFDTKKRPKRWQPEIRANAREAS